MGYAMSKKSVGYIVNGNDIKNVTFHEYIADSFEELPTSGMNIGDSAIFVENGKIATATAFATGWIKTSGEDSVTTGGGDSETTEYEVLWSASASNFTLFDSETGIYTAPYTDELPAIETGAYKFEINGEIVDGLVRAEKGITQISAYSQDMGQIVLTFGVLEGQVASSTEITNVDIKILKTDEVVDYWLYLGSPNNKHQKTLILYLPASYGFVTDELVSPDDLATGLFKITIATNDGSISWEPGWNTYFETSDYPNIICFSDNSEISTELENALKNNTPVTVTISQENGITKVITDNYVVGNRYINDEYSDAYEQDIYYRWGNGGFLLTQGG